MEVFGPDDARLGDALIDDDGMFRFTPRQSVTHRFEVNLGAGHVGDMVVAAEELPVGLGRQQGQNDQERGPEPAGPATSQGSQVPGVAVVTGPTPAEIESLIARAVQKEVLPLRRELTAYKEQNDVQGILGGLGYICGIFGLLFFVYGRRPPRA